MNTSDIADAAPLGFVTERRRGARRAGAGRRRASPRRDSARLSSLSSRSQLSLLVAEAADAAEAAAQRASPHERRASGGVRRGAAGSVGSDVAPETRAGLVQVAASASPISAVVAREAPSDAGGGSRAGGAARTCTEDAGRVAVAGTLAPTPASDADDRPSARTAPGDHSSARAEPPERVERATKRPCLVPMRKRAPLAAVASNLADAPDTGALAGMRAKDRKRLAEMDRLRDAAVADPLALLQTRRGLS